VIRPDLAVLATLPIAASDRWLLWLTETRDGKPTKVPICPKDGLPASSTNPARWSTFAAARTALTVFPADGVGIALGDGLSAIDLDGCRNPETGEIAPWAAELVADVPSYVELSPSGTGLRLLVLGKLPTWAPNKRAVADAPAMGGKNAAIEAWSEGRYVTLTGHRLGTPRAIAAVDLEAFASRWLGRRKPAAAPPHSTEPRRAPLPVQLSDQDLFDKAVRSPLFAARFRGDASSDGGDLSRADFGAIGRLLLFTEDLDQVERVMRQSGLARTKYDTRRLDKSYLRYSIEKALEGRRPLHSHATAHDRHGCGAHENDERRAPERPGAPHELDDLERATMREAAVLARDAGNTARATQLLAASRCGRFHAAGACGACDSPQGMITPRCELAICSWDAPIRASLHARFVRKHWPARVAVLELPVEGPKTPAAARAEIKRKQRELKATHSTVRWFIAPGRIVIVSLACDRRTVDSQCGGEGKMKLMSRDQAAQFLAELWAEPARLTLADVIAENPDRLAASSWADPRIVRTRAARCLERRGENGETLPDTLPWLSTAEIRAQAKARAAEKRGQRAPGLSDCCDVRITWSVMDSPTGADLGKTWGPPPSFPSCCKALEDWPNLEGSELSEALAFDPTASP